MSRAMRTTGLLLMVGALALTTTLTWRQWTSTRITDAEKQLQSRQWLAVLPADTYDNHPLDSPLVPPEAEQAHSHILAAYLATLHGKAAAVVFLSQTQGYAGPIKMTIAIGPDGRLIGVQVIEQQESPGLGGRLVDPQVNWLAQFSNRQLGDRWALKRDQGDFDQLAGATVTSRGVIEALQDALRYFDQHRDALLEGRAHE